MESCRIEAFFPVNPGDIYKAWLSPEKHAAMTGGDATGDGSAGSPFTAWDGYISGTNLELEPSGRIVQSWRTSEFSSDDEDSRIEIILEEAPGGCKFTLIHSNIPVGQTQYEQGWQDHYITPMTNYFT